MDYPSLKGLRIYTPALWEFPSAVYQSPTIKSGLTAKTSAEAKTIITAKINNIFLMKLQFFEAVLIILFHFLNPGKPGKEHTHDTNNQCAFKCGPETRHLKAEAERF